MICHEDTNHYSCSIFTVCSRIFTIVLLYWAPLCIWKDLELGVNLTIGQSHEGSFSISLATPLQWDDLRLETIYLVDSLLKLDTCIQFCSLDDNQCSSLDISSFNAIGWVILPLWFLSLCNFTTSIFHLSICQYIIYLLLFLMSPLPLFSLPLLFFPFFWQALYLGISVPHAETMTLIKMSFTSRMQAWRFSTCSDRNSL